MRRASSLCYAGATALVAGGFGLAPAAADIRVSASGDTIVVQAENASVLEILTALEPALHIKIELIGSTTRRITGSYSGPTRRVLSRLLDGTNYIVSFTPQGLHIAVLDPNARRATTPIGATAPADEDGSTAQGWNSTPPGLSSPGSAPVAAVATAPSADDADVSPAQGWNSTPSEQSSSASALRVAAAAAPAADDDGGSMAQGWNSIVPPSLASSQRVASDQANAPAEATDQDASAPQAQGWSGSPSPLTMERR